MPRHDIHRPSSTEFDPEAYRFVEVFDNHGTDGNPKYRAKVVAELVGKGYQIGAGSSGQCGHCGARIRYSALMIREDVMEFIFVGEQCLGNRFEGLTKDEFKRLREQGRLNGERTKKAEKIAALYATNPGLEQALSTNHYIISDIAYRVNRYGEISEKQVALVFKIAADEIARAQRKAEQDAKAEALRQSGVEVPTGGRILVEGTILSIKTQEGIYGLQVKMLVESDEGWKVWGTLPSSLNDAGVDRGSRVRFIASIERSSDDALFGFFKRPTQATVVS